MATVYVVRHGNTFDKGDVILRVGGRTDLPLSTSGQTQAEALGVHFAQTAFNRALVSPLKRTRITAEAILNAQPNAPEVEFTDALVEVDYGPDEGQPEEAVIARIGEDAMKAWESDATVPDGWKVDPAAIREAWQAILGDAEGSTLIVTSNGVARFLLDVAAHGGVDRKLKTGAFGVLEGSGEDWRITAWNVRPDRLDTDG